MDVNFLSAVQNVTTFWLRNVEQIVWVWKYGRKHCKEKIKIKSL